MKIYAAVFDRCAILQIAVRFPDCFWLCVSLDYKFYSASTKDGGGKLQAEAYQLCSFM